MPETCRLHERSVAGCGRRGARGPGRAWFGVAALAVAAALVLAGPRSDAAAFDALEQEIRKGGAGDGLFRQYAVECLVADRLAPGLESLGRAIAGKMAGRVGTRFAPSAVAGLSEAADAFVLLRLHAAAGGGPLPRDTAAWLLAGDARLSLFLDTISPADDWQAVLRLIERCRAHAPADSDEFANLILAMAVVWDQPRPALHGQMGRVGPPAAATDVIAYYDYFRGLFRERKAKLAYRDLSVAALVCVVDVPVPVGDLEWARQNTRGSARQWKDNYFAVRYDEARAVHGVYQWPHGAYTLEAIRRQGGICVDQGYYAVLGARAWGIPALLFVGEGRRGPHAWLAYVRDGSNWELDAGRYTYDRFATGHAVDPQTNRVMTDHELTYLCDRSLQSSRYDAATRLGRLAAVLAELGFVDAAQACAEQSLAIAPVYLLPWRISAEILRRQGRAEPLLDLLERQAAAFRRYPDVVAAIRAEQAELLRKTGREEQARQLLARNEATVGRNGRDDLSVLLASEQIRAAVDSGDLDGARRKMEAMLDRQRDEGRKVVPQIEAYLAFTKDTRQTAAAARFLGRYLETVMRQVPGNDALFLNLMLSAYENDGDARNAARVRQRLERRR